MTILTIDGGGSTVKSYDGVQLRQFPATISYDWRQRNIESNGLYDFEWEYNGGKGFAGTLAQRESDCADSMKGDTKAHPEAVLRVLLALHQYCPDPAPRIIVGQPIKTHTLGEKTAIKEMLQRKHDITVNGQRRIILVQRCEVAAEGVSAGLLVAGAGLTRVIDIGSGTVNFGTLIDRQFNDLGSFTLSTGVETTRGGISALAHQIARAARAAKWQSEEKVYLCGGGALAMLELLRPYFQNVEVIPDPVTANVRAFYMIARKVYG
ncbi:ParM/StbA family protein [Paenibacillus lupini]|uniref:ParM/StbA family protein n=1 Tax=Paenibacillus lupini TaxID=1450204 RepID=UPI001420F34A|nr:ParM/StbA family protein [Paenibacillus lupini]NIK24214.1 plasmid segregation protein ParM [Paenibacillus lupini]